MTVAALVVGAGRGERFRASEGGGPGTAAQPPKALARLGGRSLLERSAAALAAAPEIDLVVPVVAAEVLSRLPEWAPDLAAIAKLAPPVAGGEERHDSVRAGLAALPPDVAWVAVHDAARPLVRPEDVSRVVRAALETGAAILAVPCADTVKRVRDGRVVETPPRSECWAAQTPQVFRRDWLAEAHEKAAAEGIFGTDDASLVERLGMQVTVVPGDPANRKVTRAEDLALLEAALAAWARRSEGGS
jgi:2-C-methyl-D-erythritol 4-phosphate cytidylyltransferase